MVPGATTLDVHFADSIPPELESDFQAILHKLSSGEPLDAETYARITDRAARIRENVYREHGVLDIGVPAIRELRDGP